MKLESKTRLEVRLAVTIAALALLTAGVAQAQVVTTQYFAEECNDDAVRAEFEADVANGATEAFLEAKYGGCREYIDPTNECPAPGAVYVEGLRSQGAAVKYVNNSNIYYERLNGCGYHPQAEMVSCDVELRRTGGYGGFPGGTTEWVLFCLDCNVDGAWDYTTSGFVHVTNDTSGGPPSFYFEAHATTFDAPANCVANNGGWGTLRAILSWNRKPANCNSRPYWGNTFDVTIRRDP